MYSTTTTTTADHGGDTPITSIHPDIIQSHILNRLDGQTLAATSCASAQLLSLRRRSIMEENLQLHVVVHHSPHRPRRHLRLPVRPPARSIDRKETVTTPLKFDGEDGACTSLAAERLRVSWILIDPTKKRAVNVASMKSVEARRHWLTDDIQLRYATVVDGGGVELVQCGVVVSCGGKEGGDLQVREVSMQMEDVEGKTLTGLDSLRILESAMEGQRCKSDSEIEKDIYEMFLRTKVQFRERKLMRERNMDMACIVAGVSVFLAIWVFFLLR
ncbi:hypothetical protein DH2020_028044 [Rehmannia glutinosa]|uniref:F-box protein n=1 Tax=Rehmannia glutinosa TaxID=99300 RepID=A0ABR0VV92_REHGL